MEIVLFAILTGYLIFRLWSVLGTRTGEEKQSHILPYEIDEGNENVILLSIKEKKNQEKQLSETLLILEKKISSFSLYSFLEASKAVFLKVIKAFEKGDTHTLKRFLDSRVFEEFLAVIKKREEKSLTQEITINNLKAELKDVLLFDDKARVMVSFYNEQMSVTLNKEGKSFDNPSRLSIPVEHVWTFEKFFNTEDPTWLVVKTYTEK